MPDNGCPNPGPNPGQNMFVQGSCTCQVSTCYDTWSGCASNSDCCNNDCNAYTYLCGVSCETLNGGWNEYACECYGGWWDAGNDTCNYSPILVNLMNNGTDHLTGPADGVLFDMRGDGRTELVAWTSKAGTVGFLALDRNGDGMIDSGQELFGTATRLSNGQRASNGFEALAELDTNHDGRIDAADPAYAHLVLWFDSNHNGISEPDEIVPLADAHVIALLTGYRNSSRRDQYGNRYQFEGTALMQSGSEQVVRRIFDVYLQTIR
jgi:hypothetical protein